MSTQATGPAPPRPVALCALLAVAAHAVLLGLHLPSSGSGSASAEAPPPRPIHVSLVAAVTPGTEPVLPDAPAAAAVQPAPEPTERTGAAGAAAEVADSTSPSFIQEPSGMDFPDAVMPETGVQLRLHVRLGSDGQVRQLASALLPADAPEAFRQIGEKALGDARFPAGDANRAHCLQLDFKPGQPAPTWSWRTDGATRCLTNPDGSHAQALPAR